MKVILKADIKGVGKKDEIINVSDGYVRNFLFPKKLAVEANAENMAKLQAQNDSKKFKKDTEIVEEDNSDEDDEEDMTKEEKEEIKKQNKTVDYGKIASAIGKMMAQGIKVELPDINKSEFTFTPDIENNSIIFGIKGINRINNDLAKDIIMNRPYTGLKDFLSKVKSNKIAIINLNFSFIFAWTFRRNNNN